MTLHPDSLALIVVLGPAMLAGAILFPFLRSSD